MARYSRKFTVDKKTGKCKDITEPEVVEVLEMIEATTNPFKRDLFSEDAPGKSTRHSIARWPIVSTAAGVEPEDVPAEQAYLAQHGVKTEYTPQGDPIFRDKRHRYEHLKAISEHTKENGGYLTIDRDGGYGDFTG